MAEEAEPASVGPPAIEPPAQPGPAAPPVRKPSALKRLFVKLLPIVCLFQFGVLVSMTVSLLRPPATSGTDADKDPPKVETRLPQPVETEKRAPPVASRLTDELRVADTRLSQGQYERALESYQRAIDKTTGAARLRVKYRTGLCQEWLGRAEAAVATYRTITAESPESQIGRAAQLGQARIYFRLQRPDQALPLVYHILQSSTPARARDKALTTDARAMLAIALSLSALPTEKPGANSDGIAHCVVDDLLERYLDWDSAEVSVAEAIVKSTDLTVSEPPGSKSKDESTVKLVAKSAAITELLQQVAAKAGLKLSVTDAARLSIAERTVSMVVGSMPLPEFLNILMDPFSVVWEINGTALDVKSDRELSPDQRASYRVQVARRAIRDTLLQTPDKHYLWPVVRLEGGNLELAAGQTEAAIAEYEGLLEGSKKRSHNSATTTAFYNLGIAERRRSKGAAARKAFYGVVDQSPGHELAPLAYVHIGRLYLEEDEAEQAVRPLRRAGTGAPGSATQPISLLLLALAHIMTDNPRAANAVLLEHKGVVSHEEYRPMAAFLDSLSRYRAIPDRKMISRESGDLLASILVMREAEILGISGEYLVGQAYAELGLADQMAAAYTKSLTHAHGPLALRMALALGDYRVKLGQYPEARKHFNGVAINSSRKFATLGMLGLAGVDLLEKKFDDCIETCHLVLEEDKASDVRSVLLLMGRAFEQKGDYRRAALSFAGKRVLR